MQVKAGLSIRSESATDLTGLQNARQQGTCGMARAAKAGCSAAIAGNVLATLISPRSLGGAAQLLARSGSPTAGAPASLLLGKGASVGGAASEPSTPRGRQNGDGDISSVRVGSSDSFRIRAHVPPANGEHVAVTPGASRTSSPLPVQRGSSLATLCGTSGGGAQNSTELARRLRSMLAPCSREATRIGLTVLRSAAAADPPEGARDDLTAIDGVAEAGTEQVRRRWPCFMWRGKSIVQSMPAGAERDKPTIRPTLDAAPGCSVRLKPPSWASPTSARLKRICH